MKYFLYPLVSQERSQKLCTSWVYFNKSVATFCHKLFLSNVQSSSTSIETLDFLKVLLNFFLASRLASCLAPNSPVENSTGDVMAIDQ